MEEEEEEVFKDIPGYEGIYQVSNLGRVLSLARIKTVGSKATGIKERILKKTIDPNGRVSVGLSKYGCGKTHKVYKLVAAAFPDNITIDRRADKRALTHLYFDKSKKKWESQIVVNEKIVIIGTFKTKVEAYDAYISFMPKNKDDDYVNDRKKTSKYVGVCWNKDAQKWRVSITKNKTRIHLGYFNTEEEARDAYICKK